MNFEGFSDLKIHAPNLLFFDIGGVFEDINFMDTFNLAIVSIGLYVNPGFDRNLTLGSAGNLVKFFAHLPRIQRLEVQSFFLKVFFILIFRAMIVGFPRVHGNFSSQTFVFCKTSYFLVFGCLTHCNLIMDYGQSHLILPRENDLCPTVQVIFYYESPTVAAH